MSINIKFKKLHHDFKLPAKATTGSAGFDMIACIDEPLTLQPGARTAISLGCAVEVPEGYEIQVRPRSGLALKEGVTILNSPGTIN
jgi:dUTP pyrophosphatase